MTDTNLDPLILDMLDWLDGSDRAYSQVIEAWQTSCPRLTVWEDAMDRGLIERANPKSGGSPIVVLTSKGKEMLAGR